MTIGRFAIVTTAAAPGDNLLTYIYYGRTISCHSTHLCRLEGLIRKGWPSAIPSRTSPRAKVLLTFKTASLLSFFFLSESPIFASDKAKIWPTATYIAKHLKKMTFIQSVYSNRYKSLWLIRSNKVPKPLATLKVRRAGRKLPCTLNCQRGKGER